MSIIERIALEAFMEHEEKWQKGVSDLLVRMAASIEALEDRVKLLEMANATATAEDERRSFTEALAKRMTWNGQSMEGTFVTYDSGETLRTWRCRCTCDPCADIGEHQTEDCPAPGCPWTGPTDTRRDDP